MTHLVSVLVPVAVDAPYTYASDRPLAPGTIVAVPLGPRNVIAAVWHDAPDQVAPKKLRAVEHVFDTPPLPDSLLRFVDWVADYTLATRGMVLRMVLRSPEALEPEKAIVGVRLAGRPPQRVTDARAACARCSGGWARLVEIRSRRRCRRLDRRRRRPPRSGHARARRHAAEADRGRP